MAEFKGSEGDGIRIRDLQVKRERERKEFEENLKKLQEESAVRIGDISNKFAGRAENIEDQLKKETIGLVTLEAFQKKRLLLETETEEERRKRELEQRALLKKKKQSLVNPNKLSFDFDADGDAAEEQPESPPITKKPKLGKNPDVETSFLPDRERELREQLEREELARKWKEEQEKIKQEEIEITYSYWDGSGHRKTVVVTKGTSVGKFLEAAQKEFKNLKGVSVDHLMFIKEDLIIPHHFSFYDLILEKARGKSGPLFQFDVHEDIRVINDASREKEETHAAKVVERRWYEKNKHIFPASRWEVYDPTVKRDEKYTIK